MKSSNKPKNHHFVPQVYLKNFVAADINKLYAFEKNLLNRPNSGKVRTYPTSQVCYAENLYLISDDNMMKNFQVDDPLIVETKSLKYYEDRFGDIVNKLASSNEWLTLGEADIFIRTLLQMKIRNPTFFNHENALKGPIEVNNRIKKDILDNKELWEERLASEGLTIELAFKQLDDAVNRPNFRENLVRINLSRTERADGVLTEITGLLKNKMWYIHETTINDMFITSDNPGYCVNENGQLANTNFIEDFRFVFPITPYKTLIILKEDEDSVVPPFKKIHYRQSNSEHVQEINRATMGGSLEYIYSNSRYTLNSSVSHWRDYFKINSRNI
jgi:hypothetical protein